MTTLTEASIISLFAGLPCAQPPTDTLGIGDDAAVLPLAGDTVQVITTDALCSGVHFLLDAARAVDIGWKSLAVNVSDVAAMGASPHCAFLSLALPPTQTPPGWIEDFSRGFAEAAEHYGVRLVGGDTNRSTTDLFINVTVIGATTRERIKLRSSGVVGDFIGVTGPLGDARAGLAVLLEGLSRDAVAETLLTRHYRPAAQVRQGGILGEMPRIHAMMDISDGLLTDLGRLTQASGCGARIEGAAVPRSQELSSWSATHGRSALDYALAGGEDYVLLVTGAPGAAAEVQARLQGAGLAPLTIIGELTAGPGIELQLNGAPYSCKEGGFTHFRGG